MAVGWAATCTHAWVCCCCRGCGGQGTHAGAGACSGGRRVAALAGARASSTPPSSCSARTWQGRLGRPSGLTCRSVRSSGSCLAQGLHTRARATTWCVGVCGTRAVCVLVPLVHSGPGYPGAGTYGARHTARTHARSNRTHDSTGHLSPKMHTWRAGGGVAGQVKVAAFLLNRIVHHIGRGEREHACAHVCRHLLPCCGQSMPTCGTGAGQEQAQGPACKWLAGNQPLLKPRRSMPLSAAVVDMTKPPSHVISPT